MVESFDLKQYGKYLESVRNRLHLTRKDVSLQSRISEDTIYKLEKGRSLPKYDTLENLANCYKIDVLRKLLEYRSENNIYNFNINLNKLMAEFNEDDLKNIKRTFQLIKERDVEKHSIVEHRKLKQYELVIEGIELFYKERSPHCTSIFIEAMQMTNGNFTLDNWQELKYDFMELRILILIAQGLYMEEKFDQSTIYYKYCLQSLDDSYHASFLEKLTFIKIYINIGYNYHRLDQHDKALEYAKLGIDYCIKHHLQYGLPNLLYRKGTAEMFLGKDECYDSFYQSIILLDIQENEELKQRYLSITLNNYGIDILNKCKINDE